MARIFADIPESYVEELNRLQGVTLHKRQVLVRLALRAYFGWNEYDEPADGSPRLVTRKMAYHAVVAPTVAVPAYGAPVYPREPAPVSISDPVIADVEKEF